MKKATFRILVQAQFSHFSSPFLEVSQVRPIYQMDLRKGLLDRMRWLGPGQQMSCPLGLTTQTSGLVRNSCRERNKM